MKKIALLIASSCLLAGCGIQTTQTQETCSITPDSGTNCAQTPTAVVTGATEADLTTGDLTDLDTATKLALSALKNQNISLLTAITSQKGIRFSAYSYIDTGKDIILKPDMLLNAYSGTENYVRGNQDGTGDPIIHTFKDYLSKYVYDIDFAKLGEVHKNEFLSRGNSINNIIDVYSGKQAIEYYVPDLGASEEGMNRKSLTLIFTQENREWKLIGIVHNQRTI